MLLIVATAGVGIRKHFCNGIPVSQSVTNNPANCCNGSDYCHDETVYIFLDNNFFVPEKVPLPRISLISANLTFTTPEGILFSTLFQDKMTLFRDLHPVLAESDPPFTGIFLL